MVDDLRRAAVAEQIKRLLVSDLEVDATLAAAGDVDTPLLGRGVGLDSIEAMALVLALEREFGIEIPDADLTVELFASIGTLADFVCRRLEQPARP
jgi:acyl carrier protein